MIMVHAHGKHLWYFYVIEQVLKVNIFTSKHKLISSKSYGFIQLFCNQIRLGKSYDKSDILSKKKKSNT